MIKVEVTVKSNEQNPLKLYWNAPGSCRNQVKVAGNDKMKLAPVVYIDELKKALRVLNYCRDNL